MIDFLGIGAQKCGTSWLHANLLHHPDIFLPDAKEMHFWNAQRDKGVAWYLAHFEQRGTRKTGEFTPAYALLDKEVIQEIYELNPNLKLIYSIRNPIDRAWSAALMALTRSEMSIDEVSDQWFIDHFHSYGSRMRGDYDGAIARWTSVFPKEQLLVLHYEDIQRHPEQVLRQCCEHIGVDAEFFKNNPHQIIREKVNAGSGHPIRPSLLPVLEAIYAEKAKPKKPLAKTSFPPALITLGMHRSGTSTVMGLCQLMGVDIGERLFPAREDNPKGFFEHYDLIHLNEAVFEHFGLNSQDIFYMPKDWLTQPGIQALRAQMIEVVRRDFSDVPMWGLKDPRLCLLMPLWHSIFEELGCQPRFLIPFRHPAEVGASLTRRDHISARRGMLMWLRYNLALEHSSRGYPRAFLYYPDLLRDWENQLLTAASRIGLDWREPAKAIRSEVTNFLDTELRHHNAPKEPLPLWMEEIMMFWRKAATNGIEPPPQILDAIERELREIILTAQESVTLSNSATWRESPETMQRKLKALEGKN